MHTITFFSVINYLCGSAWIAIPIVLYCAGAACFYRYYRVKAVGALLLFMAYSSLCTFIEGTGGCLGHVIVYGLRTYVDDMVISLFIHAQLLCAFIMMIGVRWSRQITRLLVKVARSSFVVKISTAMSISATKIWSYMTPLYASQKKSSPLSTLDTLLRDIVHEDMKSPLITEHDYRWIKKIESSSYNEENVGETGPIPPIVRAEEKPYKLPPAKIITFPEYYKKPTNKSDYLKRSARLLEEKLALFGITGEVIDTMQGPVVTLFKYQPAADCKLSKIIALEDDLTLALQALSVRILAPVRGTDVVGFEVAFKQREMVHLAEITRSELYKNTDAALPLIIGKDSTGEMLIKDLTTMPHLLVAGSTGSGKSVCLHTFLTSLLLKKSPQEMHLLLIDPKRLEFVAYEGIPHLLFPIITESAYAVRALEWAVKLMEERYKILAQAQVRTCAEYQALGKSMPYIVIMIDELADLMMLAGRVLEEHIARLTQMARAAGIHLILATQRPSSEVITGLIKVNVPTRIAFKVSSKIDSRIILDCAGADKLVGKGDLLLLDAQGVLQRGHGAYVSHADVLHIGAYCREQGFPNYIILDEPLGGASIADDPLFEDVKRYIEDQEEISISSLQRTFRIGYNRSARIIEQLEQCGLVGPHGQRKMRKVLHKP